ncbi:MAG TPA: zinc-binding dehydrogenase [Chthonomonadales bacterium]|nr:zinc-binding dehydrogenase [Chthonomonadales bacterium]
MKILRIGPGRHFRVAEAPVPVPGDGEALLRIEAVTTCPQWDLHLRHGAPMFVGHRFHYPYTPGQPGHEASGVVEAVGPGVSDLAPGDRVSAWRDAGHDVPGCYAQYVVHRADDLIRVPAHVSFEAAAPVELAMCVGSVFLLLREMKAIAGRRFGVMGLGPAGLVALQMARAEGAGAVVGFDLAPDRRERALALGAAAAYDPREAPEAELPARPAWPGLHTTVDCVGAKASVEWAMDRTADVVALFGVQREDYTFAVRHYGGLRLCGYRGHSREAAEYAVGLIERGLLDLSPLVTHHLPLERYAEGVDLLERQEAVKVCFHPWWTPEA